MRVFDFSVEGELGTWPEAHGRSAVINSGKTPCGRPRKLGHDKLVCEPSRTGCDGVQTIVTHDRLLSMRWLHSPTRSRDLVKRFAYASFLCLNGPTWRRIAPRRVSVVR